MEVEVVMVVVGSDGRDLVVRGCGSEVTWVSVGGGEELYGSGSCEGLAKIAWSKSL